MMKIILSCVMSAMMVITWLAWVSPPYLKRMSGTVHRQAFDPYNFAIAKAVALNLFA
jgi:hypothetical protein